MLMKLRIVIFELMLIFLIGSMLFSCHTSPEHNSPKSTESFISDSLLRNINNIDTLLSWQERCGGSDRDCIYIYKRLGVVYRNNNQFIEAIDAHSNQLRLARANCDTAEMINALNNIATNNRRMSMLEEAIAFHYQALELCEQLSDKSSRQARKNRVISLNGIGNVSLSLEDYTTADSVFRQALSGEKQLGSALGQAINYANIGAIYERTGMLDSAWAYYQHSMEMNIEAGSQVGIALCHGYFGHIYEQQGKWEQALAEYRSGYMMKDKIDRWHWLNSCLNLARLYIKQGHYTSAQSLLDEAITDASQGNSLGHLATIHALYYEIYNTIGLYSKALESYRLKSIYNDSIDNKQNLIKMQNERVKYEYMRRQEEIDTINREYAQYRKTRSAMIGVLLLATIVFALAIGLLIYAIRIKKREKKALLHLDNMRTSFFTNITHEFRSPLTIIIGLGDKLSQMKNDKPSELANMGGLISRQGKNLLLLVNQILDLAKVKSTTKKLELHHGDVIGYIYMIVESAQVLAAKKDIKLSFVPQTKCVEMDFNPDYITKIVGNIIANAIKFTHHGGNISVRTATTSSNLRINIIDDGCGILPADLPYIFEAFYQGGNSSSESGTGIGLALAKQLVDALNGSISVNSAMNCGSEFTITLPIHHESNSTIVKDNIDTSCVFVQDSADYPLAKDEETDSDQLRILIVEDNKDISHFISSVIDYAQLYFASNGKEGLNLAQELVPDIIITDIMMPIMNGIEMCKEIRKSKLINHIPIIAISAKATKEDKLTGLKAGIDAYLYKPFNADELCTTIDMLLERRKVMQNNISRNLAHEQLAGDDISISNKLFINKVIDIVYKQMSQQRVNIVDIALAMNMTPRQLNNKVNAITGENVSKYVLNIRMTRAKQLLDSNNNYSIAEVAMHCGYEENSNFTRAFKSFYNITPTQYRRTPSQ